MINSVYGKTIENFKKSVLEQWSMRKTFWNINKPTFILQKIFNKIFAAIHEIKPALTLNKQIYVGFTALELSKWLMHGFHYNFIKKSFKANLLFTDMDSLTYQINSEDVYEEFFKHKNLFDFSNFLKASKFYDNQNEIVFGKIKDEYKRIPINKFVGLKSKMHCILSECKVKSNAAKGVNISLEFDEYTSITLTDKLQGTKWEELKVKNIKLEHMKSTKYHYHVLMIKDLI